MSYLGDDVPTLPWSRCGGLGETDLADKTVVTEVPWFLEQELAALAALDPNNRPTRLTPYAALPVLPDRPVATLEFLPSEPRPCEPQPQPDPEPKLGPAEVVLTFSVGTDPVDPENGSAAVIPLRAGSFRVPTAFINKRPGLWARARARLLGLACVTWALVARTFVLHRVRA